MGYNPKLVWDLCSAATSKELSVSDAEDKKPVGEDCHPLTSLVYCQPSKLCFDMSHNARKVVCNECIGSPLGGRIGWGTQGTGLPKTVDKMAKDSRAANPITNPIMKILHVPHS